MLLKANPSPNPIVRPPASIQRLVRSGLLCILPSALRLFDHITLRPARRHRSGKIIRKSQIVLDNTKSLTA